MTTARFVVSAARRTTSPLPSPSPAPVPAGPGDRTLAAARIAVWQAALAVGFAGIGRGALVTAVAALVLLVSAVRVRGEWLSARGSAGLSFILRRRTRAGDWLPLPRGSVITPTGVITGVEGLTLVARTVRMEFPRLEADAGGPELDLQLVAHRGPRQERPDVWFAVTARRSPETRSDEALAVVVDNALRRLRKAERAAGTRGFAVLGSAELRSTVIGLAHAGESRESWNSWRSGSITQISLRVRATRLDALVRLLSEGRGAAITLALRSGTEGVLRVAAPSVDAAEHAVARITELGAGLGVRLNRLDGRHGPAVLASLPIGGSL